MSLLKTPQAQKLVHEHIKQQIISGNSEANKYAAALPVETLATLPAEALANLPAEILATLPVGIKIGDENFTVKEDGSIVINISDLLRTLSVPSGFDASTLTLSIVTTPGSGTFTDDRPSADTLTFTPGPDFNGRVFFTYKLTDGTKTSNVATAKIDVTPENDAPTASDAKFKVTKDMPKVLDFSPYVSDIEGDSLTMTATSPSSGTFDPTSGLYTPATGHTGKVTFTFKVCDASACSSDRNVEIDVENKVYPQAQPFTYTTKEDHALEAKYYDSTLGTTIGGLTGRIYGLLNNAVDYYKADKLLYTVSIKSQPVDSKGVVQGTVTLIDANEGTFTYNPPKDFCDTVTFDWEIIEVSTGNIVSSAKETIIVTPEQDSPELSTLQTFTVAQGKGYDLNNILTGQKDADGDDIKVASCGSVLDSSIGSISGGVFSAAKVGTTTFSCTLKDIHGNVASIQTPFQVTVTPSGTSVCTVTPPPTDAQKQEAVKKVFYADTFLKIFNLAQEISSNLTTWDAATLKAKYDALKGLEATMSGLPGISPKAGKELSCFTKDTITGRAAYCTGGATGSNPSQGNYKYKPDNIKKDIDGILQNYSGTPSVQYDAKKNFADALTIAGGDKDCLKEIVIDSCTAHSGSNACNTLVASSYDWTDVNTLA